MEVRPHMIVTTPVKPKQWDQYINYGIRSVYIVFTIKTGDPIMAFLLSAFAWQSHRTKSLKLMYGSLHNSKGRIPFLCLTGRLS